MGMFLLKDWSRSTFPLIPCGMDLLSLLKGIVGFARSFNQISLFVSVTVTRGGGLKVDADVIWP